jgi:NitT/TauT family transport system ATP-binding protein
LVRDLARDPVVSVFGADHDWIHVDGVDKEFESSRSGAVLALQGVSFSAKRGEFLSIVGPSGCGKTTLLRILAGLVRPSRGFVRIAGTEVRGPRRDVGFVFQTPTLLPWRTVLRNVMVPIEVLSLDKEVYADRARDLIAMVGLSGFESRYPHELSGGMQQRAGICRALIHDPDVLLMDEPFGALDAMTRENMNLELLRIWTQAKKSVIFITHSIPEAVFLSDRIVVMSPRPGRSVDSVDIELQRPRSLNVMTSGEAEHYVSRIRNHFGASGAIEE